MDIIIKILKPIIVAMFIVIIMCGTITCGSIMDIPDIIIEILVMGEFLFGIIINLNEIQ